MKKITAIVLAALMLSACSVKDEPPIQQNDTEVTTTTTAAEEETERDSTAAEIAEAAAPVTLAEETSAAELISKAEYIDENGFLTEKAVEQIDKILCDNKTDTEQYYTGLYDFDLDGVPEVYLVRDNFGEGLMSVDVYNIEGKYLGGFEGYCRDGYTKLSTWYGSVYVHNFYERAADKRLNQVDEITLSEDKLNRSIYFKAYATAENNYPLLETAEYFLENEEKSYGYEEGRDHRFDYDHSYAYNCAENGVSICAYDFADSVSYEEMAEKTAEVYDLYIKWKREAAKMLESDGVPFEYTDENIMYYFDDFDGNGDYEAFFCIRASRNMYFINGAGCEKIEPLENENVYDYHYFYRVGKLLIAQSCGNSLSCRIFGVRNGEWYEPESSCGGMCLDSLLGPEAGTFLLYQSKYDAVSAGGGHTWKPFMFYDSGEEIVGELVLRDELVNRNQGDKLLAEIERLESEEFIVCEIFCFLDRYYVVNYIIEIWGENENDEWVHYTDRNYYNRYFAGDSLALIEEKGQGRYVGGRIREK